MEYQISKPSLTLSKFVKHYWTIENCLPNGQKHMQRIVPNGLSELLFYLGDKPVPADRKRTINENTLISGQLNEHYDLEVSGKLSVFSVLFKPHGLSMFLDIPMSELYNQNVPLKYIFKNDVGEIETKLYEAESFAERTELVERFLTQLLQKKKRDYNFERMENSVSLINRNKGIVDINYLASEACLSRKQYERTFSDCVGITPKQFLKIVRFQNAINEKSINLNTSLTSLTFQCGYYDQSHMINDFHKLSGMSPKQYFNECEPYSDYFN